ncbi:hypothetical protein, partial [Paenibacillus sp. MAEPY1]
MKRFVTLFLIFLMVSSSTSAYAAQPSSTWKSSYKKILNNYLKSEDFGQDNVITLVDIDQDGIPELFAGQAYRTVNHVDLAYTFKNGKAVPLKQSGPGLSEDESGIGFNLGMEGFNKGQVKIFVNKKTNKQTVIVRDGASSAIGAVVGEYAINLQGSKIVSQEISVANYSEEVDDEFTFKGKKVSKSTFDKNRIKYFSQLKQKPSNATHLEGLYVINMIDAGWSNDKIINKFLK